MKKGPPGQLLEISSLANENIYFPREFLYHLSNKRRKKHHYKPPSPEG